jgi:hypothetical protein
MVLIPIYVLQVVMPLDKKKADPSNVTLVEVGPRAALRPIRIFEGSFGGRVLYDNPEYVAPNMMRRLQKQQAAGKYKSKVSSELEIAFWKGIWASCRHGVRQAEHCSLAGL